MSRRTASTRRVHRERELLYWSLACCHGYCICSYTCQVRLSEGVPEDCINETCTSGAGTLVLEFGLLSRLLGDPIYESYARRAVRRLWEYRSNITGLLGELFMYCYSFTIRGVTVQEKLIAIYCFIDIFSKI